MWKRDWTGSTPSLSIRFYSLSFLKRFAWFEYILLTFVFGQIGLLNMETAQNAYVNVFSPFSPHRGTFHACFSFHLRFGRQSGKKLNDGSLCGRPVPGIISIGPFELVILFKYVNCVNLMGEKRFGENTWEMMTAKCNRIEKSFNKFQRF